MVVSCEEVWCEVSNYLDGDVEPGLRAAMEEHFLGCKRCTAVLDGTRNVIRLFGDERMFEVPLGFSRRLHGRLDENMARSRRSFIGWMAVAAAAVLVVGGFEVGSLSVFSRPGLRSEHAQPAPSIPADLMVVVAEDGKTFHVAGCPFIHDKTRLRTISAREAMREGYAPCVRCMRKYLSAAVISHPHDAEEVLATSEDPALK
jgi:hypothetical protein